MGRKVYRVPMDFDWPLNKPWKGFVNPHYEEARCPACKDSRGYSDGYLMLERFLHHVAMASDASSQRPSDYSPAGKIPTERVDASPRWPFDTDPVDIFSSLTGMDINADDAWVIRRLAHLNSYPGSWAPVRARYEVKDGKRTGKVVVDPNGNMYYPHPFITCDEGIRDVGPTFHKIVEALPGVREGILSHLDTSNVIFSILEAHGHPVGECSLPAWALCPICKGSGLHPDHKTKYESWESCGPPMGEGYQIWETVSEGSPISPVFDTPEGLAQYMAGRKWGADKGSSYESWLKFITGPGWAPSMVYADGKIKSGVEYISG